MGTRLRSSHHGETKQFNHNRFGGEPLSRDKLPHRQRDSLLITMNFNSSIRSRQTAQKFFDFFQDLFPELLFHSMGETEPPKNRFDPVRAVTEWESVWDCIFHGKRPAPFYVLPHWLRPSAHPRWTESVSVVFDEKFWLGAKISAMSERALTLLKKLATLGLPIEGSAHMWSEFEEKGFVKRTLPNGLVSTESVSLTSREGLKDIFWANFFGKPYTDIFGFESFEKLECPIKERTAEGFLLAYGTSPLDWKLQQVRIMQERDKGILNHGAFLDKKTGLKPNLKIGRA
jgi:hypothetical protein